jgi:hypothetical protein
MYWIISFIKSPFSLFCSALFIASMVLGWFLLFSHSSRKVVTKFSGLPRLPRILVVLSSLGVAITAFYLTTMSMLWMHFFTVPKAPVDLRDGTDGMIVSPHSVTNEDYVDLWFAISIVSCVAGNLAFLFFLKKRGIGMRRGLRGTPGYLDLLYVRWCRRTQRSWLLIICLRIAGFINAVLSAVFFKGTF